MEWEDLLDEAVDGEFSLELAHVYDGMFESPTIRSALRTLWALCAEGDGATRLLMRAAGCEILAELSGLRKGDVHAGRVLLGTTAVFKIFPLNLQTVTATSVG